jgi:hypothetical protein
MTVCIVPPFVETEDSRRANTFDVTEWVVVMLFEKGAHVRREASGGGTPQTAASI